MYSTVRTLQHFVSPHHLSESFRNCPTIRTRGTDILPQRSMRRGIEEAICDVPIKGVKVGYTPITTR